jgi:sulfite exporter TauE/SafE
MNEPVMIESIVAVFLLSLTGSLHCAGMCGAFVAFAVSTPGSQKKQNRALLHIAYNGGRLVTYCILGALAGALGAALDLGGQQVGIARTAMIFAGVVMIGFGLVTFARLRGIRLPNAPVPARWRALISRGHQFAMGKPPVIRALTIGLLTTLLPCGWLYVFAAYAASTGSAPIGALTMAVFWLGTLPILLAVGEGVGRLAGSLGRHMPALTTMAIIAVGIWTIAGRAQLPAMAQSPITAVSDDTSALENLEAATREPLPCCADPKTDDCETHAH